MSAAWNPNALIRSGTSTGSDLHILTGPEMKTLYNDARGNETYCIRFWNALLNRDFPLYSKWVVSPEQLVFRDPRHGRRRVDTAVEYFIPPRNEFKVFMIHEAKRESEKARTLERQVADYAKAILTDRFLGRVHVLTTIGCKFRAWRMDFDDQVLRPCFGGSGGTSSEYVDAADKTGDSFYHAFISEVKEAVMLPRAPPLPSTRSLPQKSASSSPSDVVMNTGGSPTEANSNLPWICGTGTWREDHTVKFKWVDENNEKKSVKSLAEKWKLDVATGHMVWHSESYGRTFACMKP